MLPKIVFQIDFLVRVWDELVSVDIIFVLHLHTLTQKEKKEV
jgi:hypothetical protein